MRTGGELSGLDVKSSLLNGDSKAALKKVFSQPKPSTGQNSPGAFFEEKNSAEIMREVFLFQRPRVLCVFCPQSHFTADVLAHLLWDGVCALAASHSKLASGTCVCVCVCVDSLLVRMRSLAQVGFLHTVFSGG